MEEKKRRKAKKKNRSTQSDNVAEVTAPLLSQEQDSALLDLEGVPSAAAVEAAAEEAPPALKQEEEEVQPEGSVSAEPYGMREELEQVVQELRSAVESETATTFRSFLEDFKASHTIAQASLEQLIEQFRKEVIQFNQWTGLQRNKEVVLDGNIQLLIEAVSQLRAMQEVQEERETAKHAEVRQLREEIAKLSEGNARQSRKVEEMSDTIQQLLLERRQSAALNLAVCPSFANEGGVAWSPETSEQLRMTPSQEMVAEAGATAGGDSHLPVAAAATMAEGFI